MQTLFFRLLARDDKEATLRSAIATANRGELAAHVFHVDPSSFRQVPGSPFAYWVSERIRCLFKELQPFECEGRAAKQGLCTADDFRFLRSWWEVRSSETLGLRDNSGCMSLDSVQRRCRQRTFEGKQWVPFSKGGAYSPYYADLNLVANWEDNGVEIQGFSNPQTGRVQSRPRSVSWYFLPGLTWTWRSQRGFNVRRLILLGQYSLILRPRCLHENMRVNCCFWDYATSAAYLCHQSLGLPSHGPGDSGGPGLAGDRGNGIHQRTA